MHPCVVARERVLLGEAEVADVAPIRLLSVVHSEVLLDVEALVESLAASLVGAYEVDAVEVGVWIQDLDNPIPILRYPFEYSPVGS